VKKIGRNQMNRAEKENR
jgi:hypothetical protein